MSYTSKYTGKEIDEKLDLIASKGCTSKVLFEGNYEDLNVITAENFLTDNIYNYDLVYIGTYQSVNTTEPLDYVRCAGTIVDTKTIVQSADAGHTRWSIIAGEENTGGYTIQGHFGNGTQLCISTKYLPGTTTSKRRHGISKVVGIKLGEGGNGSSDTTPTGTIISFMGLTAPSGYLICDNAEYNIADYPTLANHFIQQFGSVNYFGGDGTTTFAVPDMRGEFIRGYDPEKIRDPGYVRANLENWQGEDREFGKHQDATIHPHVSTNNAQNELLTYINPDVNKKALAANADSSSKVSGATMKKVANLSGSTTGTYASQYTARPTNVNVLFCIKI